MKRISDKKGWGGSREGAGRPAGSGEGPSSDARKNRVVVMLSDAELKILKGIARAKKLPLGTAAYEIISRALKRRKS